MQPKQGLDKRVRQKTMKERYGDFQTLQYFEYEFEILSS